MKQSEMTDLRIFVSVLKNNWMQQVNTADVAIELSNLLDTFEVDEQHIEDSYAEDLCIQTIKELVGKLDD